MIPIVISHHDQLNFSPAVPIAVEAWHEIIISGRSENAVLLHFEHRAITADIEGHLGQRQPVGVLVWQKLDWRSEAFVVLGYVRNSVRRHGIYRKLFNELVEKARELKLTRIAGTTHFDNAEMRAVASALGRRETSINTILEIK